MSFCEVLNQIACNNLKNGKEEGMSPRHKGVTGGRKQLAGASLEADKRLAQGKDNKVFRMRIKTSSCPVNTKRQTRSRALTLFGLI